MRYGIFIIFLIFLIVVPSFSQPAKINIMLVKEWDPNIVDPIYDKMYDALEKAIFENNSFKIIQTNYFENQTGLVLTSIFADIFDPFRLYELNQAIKLNAVILLSVNQNDFFINTLEFPSGVLIDKLIIGKNNLYNEDLNQTVQSNINSVFGKLVNNYSLNGYSFNSLDYGMIVFSDNLKDQKLIQKIDQMRKFYNDKIAADLKRLLRIKIINQNMDCTRASQICFDTGAEFAIVNNNKLLSDNEQNTFVVFPNSGINKPLIDVELPCLPNKEQFVCFNWNEAHYNIDQFGEIIFNEQIDFNQIKNTPIVLFKLFKMHKLWIEKNESAKIDPDHINDYYILFFNNLPENSIEKAWVGLNYGGYYRQTGQYVLANSLLTDTYTIFREHGNSNGMLLSLLEKARVTALLKQWLNARTWYESVLKINEIKDDTLTIAGVQYNLGLISEITGDALQAIKHYESSAYLYNNSQDLFRAMQIYFKVGRLLRENGQLDKANDYLNLCLARANELHSEPDIASARMELGLVNFNKKEYKQAFNDLTIAKSFYDLLGENSKNLALVNLKLGVINFKIKNYPEASKNFKTSLELAGNFEQRQDLIDCYQYVGDLEVKFKNWVEAQNYYDLGLNLALKSNSNPVIAEIIYKKGLAHLYEGQVQVGYDEIKKGIELSNGEVHGGQKNADAFLNKLEKAINK